MRAVIAHKAKCRATGTHTPYDEASSAEQLDLMSMMPRQKSQRKGVKQVKQIMGMMSEDQQAQMRAQIRATQPAIAHKLDGKAKAPIPMEPKQDERPKQIYVPAALRGPSVHVAKRSFPKMNISVPKLNELSQCTFGEKRCVQPFSAKRDIASLFSEKPAYVAQQDRERKIAHFTMKRFSADLRQLTLEVGQTPVHVVRLIYCPPNALVRAPGTSVKMEVAPQTARESFVDPADASKGYYREKGVWFACRNANAECRAYAARLAPLLEAWKALENQRVYIEALCAAFAAYGVTR